MLRRPRPLHSSGVNGSSMRGVSGSIDGEERPSMSVFSVLRHFVMSWVIGSEVFCFSHRICIHSAAYCMSNSIAKVINYGSYCT